MIRNFCRIVCVVLLIGDLQSSLSQLDSKRGNLSNTIYNNGSIAFLGEAVHQASIRLIDQDITFGEGHICSGSVISTRAVLTAARCLLNLKLNTLRHPSELIVVMGTINRSHRTSDTVISRITHIRYPKSFDLEKMGDDDIGLLFLSRELPENHLTVRPIELNWRNNENDYKLGGSVTGWETSKNGNKSHQLRAANVTIVERINCADKFGQQFSITNNMICGKYKIMETEICQSDIGAPLVYGRKQIGLATRTISSCSTKSDQLAVYTNVGYHIKWIRRELIDQDNTDSSVWGFVGFLTLTWLAFKKSHKISL